MEVVDNDDQICMMPGCTEVDLLPAKCTKCRKLFCSRHIGYAEHNCTHHQKTENIAAMCPLCGKPVPVRPGQSADAAVNIHIESGCATGSNSATSQRFETTRDGRMTKERHNFCCVAGCTRNEIQLILCGKCGQSVCVDHRAPALHKCPAMTPPPQAVKADIAPSAPMQAVVATKKPASPPSSATNSSAKQPAAKRSKKPLKERRWQNSATKPFKTGGSSDNELIVGVFFPDDSNVDPCYFSVAPSMVVGRFIDIIGKQVDLPNRNNATLPEEERVTLFNLNMLMQLPSNLRMDEAAIGTPGGAGSGEGLLPMMMMITRGPKLPIHVEAEVAELQQIANGGGGGGASGGSTAVDAKKKKDCVAM